MASIEEYALSHIRMSCFQISMIDTVPYLFNILPNDVGSNLGLCFYVVPQICMFMLAWGGCLGALRVFRRQPASPTARAAQYCYQPYRAEEVEEEEEEKQQEEKETALI